MLVRLFGLSMLLSATAVMGADLSGRWEGSIPTHGDETRDVSIQLKQQGAVLSGTLSVADITASVQDGKVDGDKLSFSITVDYNGDSVKVLFEGAASGAELKLTREIVGRGGKQAFTVKRAG